MKKTFTQKMSLVALGALLLTSQLKATDPVKVDYTDRLVNPSFEYFVENGAVNLNDPIDVTKGAADSRLYNNALRGTPPGWMDSGITLTQAISYGINRGAVGKDGFNMCWYSPSTSTSAYSIYQEVNNLPAGQYIVSCKMVTWTVRLVNQRFFAQTQLGETVTNNIVQYIGKESDYNLNLTQGETNTFAGWELGGSTVSDTEARLKPMSIVINVAEGEKLIIGMRSGNMKADGTTTNSIAIKMDDFRLTKVVDPDPNDYTTSIINPSFEKVLIEGVPTLLKTHNIAAYSATDPQRGVPYGWSDIIDDSANPIPNPSIGNSYGVNTDANGIDGSKNMWALRTPFVTSYTLYQDISTLPAGRYMVSCNMFVEDGKLTTQRLFANNKVSYYGVEEDYDSGNLTSGEVNSYSGLTTSPNSNANGFFLKKLSVEVEVTSNENLRIGIKSGNIKKSGVIATGSEGWFKADNFRLQRIGDLTPTGNAKINESIFSVNGQKAGFWLNMEKATLATVKVCSPTGQSVYETLVNSTKSWIALPQGLYIVQVSANGINNTTKVLVK
ncbi:MAG: T9SS type A sorting domain-containing protein [Paludibacter sp.]|nr:T9SS type A sorting domain-containing protein [Paludibacter sp.]